MKLDSHLLKDCFSLNDTRGQRNVAVFWSVTPDPMLALRPPYLPIQTLV